MKQSPRYKWQLLRTGPIRLDGGGMFGVIPRVLWSKGFPPDEQNRITLGQNSLLLHRAGSKREGEAPAEPGFSAALGSAGASPSQIQSSDAPAPEPGRVLIEVGSGDKFNPKMRNIYGLEDRSIIDAMMETGTRCEEIERVVVTHLHFDHAGGLTRKVRNGENADWKHPENELEAPAGVKRTFPNARIIVQRREWEDALANRSVMTRTYLRDHLEPICDQLDLVDSPMPSYRIPVPDRSDGPTLPLRERETEILPGIFVFLVPGHTWGQQAVRFTDDRGRGVVFTPDLMPTIQHLGSAYSMGYDVEPYTSGVTKRWFLQAACENDWLLVLDHEPGNPLQRVRSDGKGWYQLIPEEQ